MRAFTKQEVNPAQMRVNDARATATPPVSPGLGLLLRKAHRAFAKELDRRLAQHGVTHAQWVLLWFLHIEGRLTPLELSRAAGIKKASATRAIQSLVRRGLVAAARDAVDGRKINLSISPNGQKTVVLLLDCATQANERTAAALTSKELEHLKELLRKIIRDVGDE